jgi:hypothetical protein
MGTETDKLLKLCNGVRAISPGMEVKVISSQDNVTHFSVAVCVSSVVIFATDFGLLDTVLSLAISKLANISQRTLAAVKPSDE